MRQIILDTETTGLETQQDHRIIEIGCVEMVDRRLTGNNFHQYLQPDRQIDAGAISVHGITNEFLEDKPRFADIVEDLISYLSGAELVIHNAPFDVGFLNHELKRLQQKPHIEEISSVVDTLVMARKKHPGKRNSLDALCDRYAIDNSRRDKHGALLDAEILSEVYLAMTGGQEDLLLEGEDSDGADHNHRRRVNLEGELMLMQVDEDDLQAHEEYLNRLQQQTDGHCMWLK
ncbi:MAG TPA: DNA polymerase III subunit epsilon [Gammaproteobacteria bacterium]|nr:DNA polymerase III subunit epsilon [Gammaproteobacteria bacterium]